METEKIDLDYYLWRNKILVKDFAKRINVSSSQLSIIRHRKMTPNLRLAMKIHKESNEQIAFSEMIALKDVVKE